jgi:uncharacterized membrane protein (DUF485 family)
MSPLDTPPTAGKGGSAPARDRIDWVAAERSPEFRELIREKRSFVVPATIFFLAWYFGFILLAGYAEGFMGESIYEGFTVGYALALSQFVMTWGLGFWYMRRANRDWDPLARRAAEHALQQARDTGDGQVAGDGHADREGVSR